MLYWQKKAEKITAINYTGLAVQREFSQVPICFGSGSNISRKQYYESCVSKNNYFAWDSSGRAN